MFGWFMAYCRYSMARRRWRSFIWGCQNSYRLPPDHGPPEQTQRQRSVGSPYNMLWWLMLRNTVICPSFYQDPEPISRVLHTHSGHSIALTPLPWFWIMYICKLIKPKVLTSLCTYLYLDMIWFSMVSVFGPSTNFKDLVSAIDRICKKENAGVYQSNFFPESF